MSRFIQFLHKFAVKISPQAIIYIQLHLTHFMSLTGSVIIHTCSYSMLIEEISD